MLRHSIIKLIFILLLIPLATASTEILIYVDDLGHSEFYGQTIEISLSLPSGVTLEDGKIRGGTNELTSKSGDMWFFSYSLQNANIRVFLPSNAKIRNANGEISIIESTFQSDYMSFYSLNNVDISYSLEDNSVSSTPFLILISIIVLLSILILTFRTKSISFNKKKKETSMTNKKLEIIKEVLGERDKLILNTLKETGKIKSSYLRKHCDIPKSSFSRHISELNKKGLLILSGEGKNKFIELSS